MNKHTALTRPAPFSSLAGLPTALSAASAASLMAAVGDVALILSLDGVILDVAAAHGDLANLGFTDWAGARWCDTVTGESRVKIAEMIEDARRPGAPPRWRQVNHPAAGGDVPVRYLAMALGDSDRLIAIGRDMRGVAAMQQRLLQTQQSLERDYIRLRQAESRYRLLFDMASEPVLIVDAASRRIREANPAAQRLLDGNGETVVGALLHELIDPRDRDDLIGYLGASEAADERSSVTLRLAEDRGEVALTARLFRQARAPLLLVRIGASPDPASERPRHDTTLGEVVERMPDAFVLADHDLTVLTANAAFVELTELPSADRVRGVRLSSWIGRPGVDLDLIMAQLREHGSVRNVSTILRGAAGAEEQVELSGVAAPGGQGECYGFTIRLVGRRLRDVPPIVGAAPRSVEQLTELVGRMSLKEIVRESTDLIERLCIEAALAYTSDNRALAAEILGLSRQSLYSKLHRHGLGNLVAGNT